MGQQGYFLVRGDKTTCGGKIIEGADDHTIMGIPQAREMDKVTCGKHSGIFQIVGGVPQTDIHGRLMAGSLDSKSSCPCKARFIATMMNDTYEVDGGESGKPEQRAQSVKNNAKKYSHQIKLHSDVSDISVQDVPWVFIFSDGTSKTGKTNQLGESERIYTDASEKVTALIGKLAWSWQKRGNAFGSLKKIMDRKIELITEENLPVKNIPWISGRDHIVVVAARTIPENWYGKDDTEGNQYRFINCGIKQLQSFPPARWGNTSVQRIMVVFQLGYTSKDIGIINKYAESFGARIVYVRNKDELVSFFNQRKEKNRLIKELVLLCHGVIKTASFHYHHEDEGTEKAGMFKHSDIENVDESIFDLDAMVTTYACRAGISNGDKEFNDQDAGQKDSPAQKMADCWDVSVKAFEMRSSYAKVYGTKQEIKEAREYGPVVEKYERDMGKYKQEKENGNNNATPPKKPEGYDEKAKRYNDVIEREENDNSGGPIAPNGAWRMPETGDTPKGLKHGLQDYQPKEWKK
ncbi:PAAR domain-containing protein [Salmonella enterica]|nr:PAAR domain-containing protein [Salmonella enterica]